MSRPKILPSGNRRSATLVHRFVRMRFVYFTNIGFDSWNSTALARCSHHQGIKICFHYSRLTTIINHRAPSFTSAGVLRALDFYEHWLVLLLPTSTNSVAKTNLRNIVLFSVDLQNHRSAEMASSNLRALDCSIGL